MLVGLLGGALGGILMADDGTRSEGENKTPEEVEKNKQTGAVLLGIGGGVILVGAIIKLSSIGSVGRAVDVYNKGLSKSKAQMELKIGITGNGVGLALRF